MSTNSSNLIPHKTLASEIMGKLNSIAEDFSTFQNNNTLACPPDCGKCCFKADIYSTPIEMLPMALDLYERGIAQEMYDKCLEHKADHCLFMKISDLENGKGRCTEYQFRPLVCRTFGVAARRDKSSKINFSVCTTLKESKTAEFTKLISTDFTFEEVPFIDISKNRLSTLSPQFLEEEFPINESLAIMLAKILFISSLESD